MNLLAYPCYQWFAECTRPARAWAACMRVSMSMWPLSTSTSSGRTLDAWCELFECCAFSHRRPPFGIDAVDVDGATVPIVEHAATGTPFGTLLHFRKALPVARQPRVLIVAPMSGHFATLLRGTVRTMLADHDVYITDWHNPRDIPLRAGRFGFDEYVRHVIDFIRHIGPDAHVLAICQPTVAALAAVALMAAGGDPAQPASLTLMAGPIDCRVNPTKVNALATSRPIDWFARHLISVVPSGFPGAQRRVYPGFVQVGAFMSMNPDRHASSFSDLYYERAKGDPAKADALRYFYDEYFATADLTAEFYLETVEKVFQQYALARGELTVGGQLVEPAAIHRTALLTIEGEKDDICAVGQTVAAQELCSGLPPYLKTHHVQTGVGHYGVFNGSRWESQIYPIVRATIHDNEPYDRTAGKTDAATGTRYVTLHALLAARMTGDYRATGELSPN
ncbi:poly(3-hydroxybutyrate) depolymerase [Burkholderia ubonensis]|uniref:polyhydroxyalkanoate depolymerase n=1 Tax=Burkholderia ubonensis TaxID=101571 RepID=UPI000754AC5C|nr:polyhydroxyalkanoate depolymerase [Burkholderia ubonensis]KVD53015.1 poly(3-hydroxybutyrate) depolymerase [Burkholderia ubonensis]KWB56186.1 poly(3-hydroxybutyrate) depolymerase [Burkholderia ubonensis]